LSLVSDDYDIIRGDLFLKISWW